MKIIKLLLLTILIGKFANSQCHNIIYKTIAKRLFEVRDTVSFQVTNFCKASKFVLYSLEYYDSTNEWQELDNDIFTLIPKGMKIVKLLSRKSQKFLYPLDQIDRSLFRIKKKVRFRIVENLYSTDRIQIIRTRTVKEFTIMEN